MSASCRRPRPSAERSGNEVRDRQDAGPVPGVSGERRKARGCGGGRDKGTAGPVGE